VSESARPEIPNPNIVSGVDTGKFIVVCIVIGPAIGFVLISLWIGVVSPLPISKSIIFDGSLWFFAYLAGAPIAFIAACSFIFIAYKFNGSGLVSALIATLVPVILLAIWYLAMDTSVRGIQMYSIRAIPLVAIVSLAAMTVCWVLARALRIVQ